MSKQIDPVHPVITYSDGVRRKQRARKAYNRKYEPTERDKAIIESAINSAAALLGVSPPSAILHRRRTWTIALARGLALVAVWKRSSLDMDRIAVEFGLSHHGIVIHHEHKIASLGRAGALLLAEVEAGVDAALARFDAANGHGVKP